MDKGIIFSAPMVRALLDGRKTQTRRLLKDAPKEGRRHCDPGAVGLRWVAEGGAPSFPCITPYHRGDRLYVREAWRVAPELDHVQAAKLPHDSVVFAEADKNGRDNLDVLGVVGRRRASMHMPRWASRLWLEVADVRVQRVGEISDGDAEAEGVATVYSALFDHDNASPRTVFAALWNSLHTKPGETWADNPWIVAVSFDVRHGNIDRSA